MTEQLGRRSFLIAAVGASASLALPHTFAGNEQAAPKRRIFAVGGQAFSDPGKVLLHFLLSLTGKNEPLVYFLPTASGENPGQIAWWYEEGLSDSRPERLTVVKGLGFLKGGASPHYSPDSGRGRLYNKMLAEGEIKEGIGCDDGAGVLFEGTELTKVVSASSNATAYRIRRVGEKVVEERLKSEVLDGQTK